nr:Leucine-rich repeat-containing protein 45 [Polyrhizophydium stewartii]
MESFRASYVSRCAELAVQPLQAVLDALSRRKAQVDAGRDADSLRRGDAAAADNTTNNSGGGGAAPPSPAKRSFVEKLDLSGQSVPLKACTALSLALADDCFFTRIVLADAFLGDDGCILIAGALKTNTTVTYLDLRGNSIRADGAIALGQMLKINTALKRQGILFRPGHGPCDILNLEWNCIGIWESGVRAIADALSINQTLEELDLRNNKIGPQASHHIALCLKHNTRLRKLDFRWNNAGLIGGRAFLDLLKWNVVLMDLDMTGNEIPEDIHRGIASALERNRDRFKHELHTKAHTENLTSTLQTLTQSHQEAISKLSSKLAATDQTALSLSQKLSLASSEIAEAQDAYRMLQAKIERLTNEKHAFEEQVVKERSQTQAQITDLQRELVAERERRIKAEDGYQKLSSQTTTRLLELEAALKRAEMDCEVLRRDKAMLLDDIAKSKEKEKAIAQLWEEKLQRHESISHNKLLALQSAKDDEIAERGKKYEERIRALELDKTPHVAMVLILPASFREHAVQEIDAIRTRHMADKRHWAEELSEAETRIHRDEVRVAILEARRKDLEVQLQNLLRQRDTLQAEAASHLHTYTQSIKEHEAELKRLQEQRGQLNHDISDLKAKESHYATDITQLRARLEDARRETKAVEAQLASSQADAARLREAFEREKRELVDRERRDRRDETDKQQQQIHACEATIARLKDEIRKRDEELEASEEENMLKVRA